ncbi:MAG: FAD:protein FMN transferase [Tannerella sp.]|jgi:thiamine biosynthesis lipoprotein|nr:FAD:protein FMN transferase [Tannerella sp.]
MSYSNFYGKTGILHSSVARIMGTRFDALLIGTDEQRLKTLWDNIERQLRRIEKMLNRFDHDSEVSHVNTDAQFTTVTMSEEFDAVMLDCKKYYELTDGCFDITKKNFNNVILNAQTVQFNEYGLSLDFGGYAKGYALKHIKTMLHEADIERALINFGNSSALATGSHPNGDSWSIGIEDPYNNGITVATIKMKDSALSVSGNSPANPQHIIGNADKKMITATKMVAVETEDPLDAEVITTAWIASGSLTEPQWMKNFNVKTIYII